MRAVSKTIQENVSRTVTTPAYFIELQWPIPIRLATRGPQTWDGKEWVGGRVKNLTLGESGVIELVNTDLAYSAMILLYGATDVPCKIWKYYDDNPSATDPHLLFDGATSGSPEITVDTAKIKLVRFSTRTMYSPRRFIGPTTGFSRLKPAGSTITWGGQTYVLERSQY